MNTITDVIIHTSNPLDRTQFDAVAGQMKGLEGVLKFERNEARPKFIQVVYNAGQTRALSILNKLTRMGFNASLVGI